MTDAKPAFAILLRLDNDLVSLIDAYRSTQGVYRSQAIRQLLYDGLQFNKAVRAGIEKRLADVERGKAN